MGNIQVSRSRYASVNLSSTSPAGEAVEGSGRIAILTAYRTEDFAGGVEVFNTQLAACFPDLEIFAGPSAGSAGTRSNGLDHVGLDHPRRAWYVSRAFLAAHRRRPFSLVICNGVYGWPLTVLRPQLPTIEVYHFTWAGLSRFGISERGVRLRTGLVTSRFDRLAGIGKNVVAVGRNVLREVQRFYGHDGDVIANGVDLNRFGGRDRGESRDELGIPRDATVALFVGRSEYAKGYDIVLKVARALPSMLFVVVGGRPMSAPNIVVQPRVAYERMPALYSASDFLFLPSRYEGFNLSVLEALACDVPIVVSRAAYPLEEDWRPYGFVVDTFDPQAYTRAIQDLLAGPTRPSTRALIAPNYSSAAFAARWRAKIRALIS